MRALVAAKRDQGLHGLAADEALNVASSDSRMFCDLEKAASPLGSAIVVGQANQFFQ